MHQNHSINMTESRINAINFLLKEHKKVKKLFAEISADSQNEVSRKEKFGRLRQDLITHETMEQKIWYPNLESNARLNKIIVPLISEEKNAEEAIHDVDNAKTEKEWTQKFNQLKQDVIQHAHEEETKLFPEVKKLINGVELERIGQEMQNFKEKQANP